jgi:hypothetical protein
MGRWLWRIFFQPNIGHQANKIRTETLHLGNIFPTLLGIPFSPFDVTYGLFTVIPIYPRVLLDPNCLWSTGFLQGRNGEMTLAEK